MGSSETPSDAGGKAREMSKGRRMCNPGLKVYPYVASCTYRSRNPHKILEAKEVNIFRLTRANSVNEYRQFATDTRSERVRMGMLTLQPIYAMSNYIWSTRPV